MVWFQQVREMPIARYILLPEGNTSFSTNAKPQGKVVLLIGAEGGFTTAESNTALQCGFESIRMGSRVMRTETAAVAGLAALQTLWGDFQ
jgi:16S rRNA (uracil1498-N3)-methyltransferase